MTDQITLKEAIRLIDSSSETYSLHTVIINDNGNKMPVYEGDYLTESHENTIESFVKETNNYGSFWLKFYGEMDLVIAKYQIVDENGEPV
jgi:hypothetical protein